MFFAPRSRVTKNLFGTGGHEFLIAKTASGAGTRLNQHTVPFVGESPDTDGSERDSLFPDLDLP